MDSPRPDHPTFYRLLTPTPEPAPGEVLVRVRAAAVNPTVTAKHAGERGDGIKMPGMDAAGERGVQFRPIGVPNYAREHAKLDALRQQVEDGQLSPRVAEEFPAEQAKEAHRHLEGGGVRGRLVLTF